MIELPHVEILPNIETLLQLLLRINNYILESILHAMDLTH